MIRHLFRRLVGAALARRRRTLDLRYCSRCWDYTACWRGHVEPALLSEISLHLSADS